MKWKAALVDFDGTLADSMPFWLDLPRQTLIRAGIPEPADFAARQRAVPLWEFAEEMSRAFPRLTRERPLAEQWYAAMEENYRTRIRLKPGALELLKLFRAEGLTVVILSATRNDLLIPALKTLWVAPLADRVWSEEEVGSKRTAEPYRFCAGRLGVALEELFLVEDAPRNLFAAGELGLGTVGVYDAAMEAFLEEIRRRADVYLPDYRDLDPMRTFLGRNGS